MTNHRFFIAFAIVALASTAIESEAFAQSGTRGGYAPSATMRSAPWQTSQNFSAPRVTAPMTSVPTYSAAISQRTFTQPIYSQPSYSQPIYSQPTYSPSYGYRQPIYSSPIRRSYFPVTRSYYGAGCGN